MKNVLICRAERSNTSDLKCQKNEIVVCALGLYRRRERAFRMDTGLVTVVSVELSHDK